MSQLVVPPSQTEYARNFTFVLQKRDRDVACSNQRVRPQLVVPQPANHREAYAFQEASA